MKQRILICGTGTEVGKTHVGVALLGLLGKRGKNAVGLKPVESGVGSGESDAQRLARASVFHVKQPPYGFERPVSAHLAARDRGVVISLQAVRQWVDEHDADWQIVETAGGLLSPISQASTNLDLIRCLEPTAVVVVAVDRLGVLHDVSATLLALRTLAPGIAPCHVVLSEPAQADPSTHTNASELERLGVCQRPLCFPRSPIGQENTQAAAAALLAALEAASEQAITHPNAAAERDR